jgi:predicted ATPase
VASLQGEAGIGKTRLATEFLGWAAAQGADVIRSRAFETGGRLSYQPLVDALRPRFDRENAPEDLLSDHWLIDLSRLLPELRERYPDLPPFGTDDAAARTRLYEAIARLVQALADRAPVVQMVDDVQWADAAPLDVLHYSARRWVEGGSPVFLLFCLRSETPAVTQLVLGPLTSDDTMQLVQALDGSPSPPPEVAAFARWIFEETSGQPLFVIETLKALLDQGILAPGRRADGGWGFDLTARATDTSIRRGLLPPGVQRVIHSRLARLNPDAREFLMASAVLGQGFTFEQVC